MDDTLGGTLLTCSLKNQRTMTLSSTKAEYVAVSEYAQEVNFVGMFIGGIFMRIIKAIFSCEEQASRYLYKSH